MVHNSLRHLEPKVTRFSCSSASNDRIFSVAVERAVLLARQADIIAALSTEALRGTVRSLHPSEYSLSLSFINILLIRSSCISTSHWAEFGRATVTFPIEFPAPSIGYRAKPCELWKSTRCLFDSLHSSSAWNLLGYDQICPESDHH